MERNILIEVNRVREIMGLVIPIIQEQEKTTKIKKGENVTVQKAKWSKKGMYSVGDDSPSKFIKSFINGIVTKLKSDKLLYNAFKAHTLQLAKAVIRTGASNWFKTPLVPEKNNLYGVDPKNSHKINWKYYKDRKEKNSLSKSDHPDWIENKDLAKRRAAKFLVALKEGLEKKGVDILPAIEEKVYSRIVDTGGKIDKERNTTDFPNRGQFIEAKLSFAYDVVTPMFEEITECLGDMVITVAYIPPTEKYKNRLNSTKPDGWSVETLQNNPGFTGGEGTSVPRLSDEDIEENITEWRSGIEKSIKLSKQMASKYGLPESSRQHCCDAAEFHMYLNGTWIGEVNLNSNASEEGTMCGPVVEQLVVSQEEARRIATSKWLYKNNGKVNLYMQGKSANQHSEIPIVKVVNGLGETLYLGEPGGGKKQNRGHFDERKKLLGPFSPCEPIKST